MRSIVYFLASIGRGFACLAVFLWLLSQQYPEKMCTPTFMEKIYGKYIG
jgi:hypothetical protein